MSKSVSHFGQTRWPALTEDGKVSTEPFLKACETIVEFFDALGALFAPVKHDIQGNVNKLLAKYVNNPETCKTMQDMIEHELNSSEGGTATESLLWLKRGLHFVCLLLLSIVEDYEKQMKNESLIPNYQYAYNISLKPYHNWLVQKFFTVCVKSRICPKRCDLMKSLASEDMSGDEDLIVSMKQFVNGLMLNLQSIFDFYVMKGLDTCKNIS